MKSIEKRKKELFKGIINSIDRDLKLRDNREALIVSASYEKTFDLMIRIFDNEIRKNYFKKNKAKPLKENLSRLQTIQ